MYPRIIIDLDKLKENILGIKKMARRNQIESLTYVVKAFAGDQRLFKLFADLNVESVGDSRIQNFKLMQDYSFKKMLLRIPMISEVNDVVNYADVSLSSELQVIKALDQVAAKANKKHRIIIMFDLGDLREGIYYKSDYLNMISEILKMQNIELQGIGTNLTCYGGLVPSTEILNRLIKIKNDIEKQFEIKLTTVSGGNSSSVNLFDTGKIPVGINHLRIGEAYLLGKETAYSTDISELNQDVFHLEAEIIELKEKPSYPDGDISINSFGVKPEIEDKGLMTRAIIAIGKQDVILENLFPFDKDIIILGGSSDHLIVEIKADKYQVGDIIKFKLNYPALLHLMNSDYVEKIYK